MIAAIAISNELPLYTCNPGDFRGIDGLTIVAVPIAGRPLTQTCSTALIWSC